MMRLSSARRASRKSCLFRHVNKTSRDTPHDGAESTKRRELSLNFIEELGDLASVCYDKVVGLLHCKLLVMYNHARPVLWKSAFIGWQVAGAIGRAFTHFFFRTS